MHIFVLLVCLDDICRNCFDMSATVTDKHRRTQAKHFCNVIKYYLFCSICSIYSLRLKNAKVHAWWLFPTIFFLPWDFSCSALPSSVPQITYYKALTKKEFSGSKPTLWALWRKCILNYDLDKAMGTGDFRWRKEFHKGDRHVVVDNLSNSKQREKRT